MIKAWTEEAWEDFEYWTTQDRRMLKRILQLLKDIDREGLSDNAKALLLSLLADTAPGKAAALAALRAEWGFADPDADTTEAAKADEGVL